MDCMTRNSIRQKFPIRPAALLAGWLALLFAMPATAMDYDCMMEPSRLIDVRSTVKGRIQDIKVERSEFVTAGQPLVVFESDVEQASLELARARMEREAELKSSQI
ncbi:MAG: hypothetical protein R3308_07520, partial [Thiohalobacterales bacterium]|nr:hypothetical protein [Thiohalobacterales bacterium]